LTVSLAIAIAPNKDAEHLARRDKGSSILVTRAMAIARAAMAKANAIWPQQG